MVKLLSFVVPAGLWKEDYSVISEAALNNETNQSRGRKLIPDSPSKLWSKDTARIHQTAERHQSFLFFLDNHKHFCQKFDKSEPRSRFWWMTITIQTGANRSALISTELVPMLVAIIAVRGKGGRSVLGWQIVTACRGRLWFERSGRIEGG